MTDFVIAHGAWSAGWAWKKMRPRMAARGHTLWTPTYTGLGERAHLASPDITLDTHIQDVVAHVEIEDHRDFILVGHSYGGMVATGVADRVADRITALVYLDAFVPRDGESLAMLGGTLASLRARAIDGWRIPASDMPPDTPEADRTWAAPRRMPQPIGTLETPLKLAHGETKLPRHYIYCTRPGPGDVFRRFYERAQGEAGWSASTIDASHNPHITAPETLADLLDGIAKAGI